MKPSLESEKNILKSLVRDRFAKPLSSQKSFEELAELTRLSAQTLRRFFGKIDHHNKASVTTLSLLCQFVGYQDWTQFLEKRNDSKAISERDKILIESMSVFFKNGLKHNTDYFRNTATVDTLNDYAKIIYSSKENVEYFYCCYKENNWATDYILAWIPNYNLYGQPWFREIMLDKSRRTTIPHVRMSQTAFLHFGAFLSEIEFDFEGNFKKLQNFYADYQKDSVYMPYHEMRFCTIRLMEAKRNGQTLKPIIVDYLQKLRAQKYSDLNVQEILIFFCNTLIWLEEFQTTFEIIQEIEPYFQNKDNDAVLHYYGMNSAFVKMTFGLIYQANGKKARKAFEVNSNDFNDHSNLLFHDYIQVMYLAKCILKESGITRKKQLFEELKAYVGKTNYRRIYRVLRSLDSDFPAYFS